MKKLVALAIVVVVVMSGGHLFAQLSKDAAIG
jgi:hypothetical protein